MAARFQEAAQRGGSLGLQPDELAFYDALASIESAVREMGDEALGALPGSSASAATPDSL